MSTHEEKIIKNLLLLMLSNSQKSKSLRGQTSPKLKITLPAKSGRQLKLKSSAITLRVTVGW
jgi:hypothetical protein